MGGGGVWFAGVFGNFMARRYDHFDRSARRGDTVRDDGGKFLSEGWEFGDEGAKGGVGKIR